MSMKFSPAAFALLASISSYAAAETIVPGSAVTAEADIVVSADNSVGLEIKPVANLTVADIKSNQWKRMAELALRGDNFALRMVNADPAIRSCSWLTGSADPTNRIHACLHNPYQSFQVGGETYYVYTASDDASIRAGGANANPQGGAKVGADTYKLSMEAISYTN